MKDMDTTLDDNPALVSAFIDLDIRNAQAHRELTAYNNTGRFIGEHPLVRDYLGKVRESDRLRRLRSSQPDELLRQIANTKQNIRRIESNIRRKKYRSEQELESWNNNLANAKSKLDIMSKTLQK